MSLFAIAGMLSVAACGGDDARTALSGDSDDTEGTDPPATDPPVTEAPTTEPPATDPPATDPPVTDPPVTEPPATDPPTTDAPPATDGVDEPDPAFCGASSQFFVEAQALQSIEGDDDEAARQLFQRMEVSLTAAVINAPDAASAEAPEAMQAVFDVLLPAFESVDYDADAIGTLPNADEINASFDEFVVIIDRLEVYLDDVCGVDIAGLRGQAEDLASEVSSTGPVTTDSVPTTDGPPTTDSVPDGDTVSITDDSGTIVVDVPADWTDVRGEPDGPLRQLFAAPDVDAFFAAYSEPGVAILAGDAPQGDGAEAAKQALDGFVASAEADGCTQNIAAPYDDGVYVGDREVYSCPGSASTVNLAAGTNAEGDVFWLFAVVAVEGDTETVSLVEDTFFVD